MKKKRETSQAPNLIDRLSKRVEIQKKYTTSDNGGGFREEWTESMRVWAEIKPIDAFEKFEAEKISEKITHVITIRYTALLSTNDRIKFNERIFNIKGMVNPFEKNLMLEIFVEEEIY